MGAFNAPKLGQRRLAQADRALHHCTRCLGVSSEPPGLGRMARAGACAGASAHLRPPLAGLGPAPHSGRRPPPRAVELQPAGTESMGGEARFDDWYTQTYARAAGAIELGPARPTSKVSRAVLADRTLPRRRCLVAPLPRKCRQQVMDFMPLYWLAVARSTSDARLNFLILR